MTIPAPANNGRGSKWDNMWSLDRIAVLVALVVQLGVGVAYWNILSDSLATQATRQEKILTATENMRNDITELKIETRVGKEDVADIKSIVRDLASEVRLNSEFRRAAFKEFQNEDRRTR